MNFFDQVLKTLNSVPPEAWSYISMAIETFLGALFVSPVMLGIKKWFAIEGEKKMLSLVMLASAISTVVIYLTTLPQFAPWIIPIQAGLLFATTQPVYNFFVKPACRRLGAYLTEQITKATMVNEAKAAAVPP